MLEYDARLTLTYFLDALHFKMYSIKYPAFCAMDLITLIKGQSAFQCGYHNSLDSDIRILPLHAQDPFLNYSAMHFFFNHTPFYGHHELLSFDFDEIQSIIENWTSPISQDSTTDLLSKIVQLLLLPMI